MPRHSGPIVCCYAFVGQSGLGALVHLLYDNSGLHLLDFYSPQIKQSIYKYLYHPVDKVLFKCQRASFHTFFKISFENLRLLMENLICLSIQFVVLKVTDGVEIDTLRINVHTIFITLYNTFIR